jgi:hypothetical protein
VLGAAGKNKQSYAADKIIGKRVKSPYGPAAVKDE